VHGYILLTSFIGLIIAGLIFWLIRRDHLHIKYSLWWLIIAVGTVILGFFPQIVDRIADQVGISYPPILAVVVAFGIVLIKMLIMDIESSSNRRKIIRLTQRLAILEQQLENTQQDLNKPEKNKEKNS